VSPPGGHTFNYSVGCVEMSGVERVHTREYTNRGSDKSLARPGRKQATATEDCEFHISYL